VAFVVLYFKKERIYRGVRRKMTVRATAGGADGGRQLADGVLAQRRRDVGGEARVQQRGEAEPGLGGVQPPELRRVPDRGPY
jgi:hypothetical protein